MNRITDYKKLQDDIVAWIREYATTNNIKSLVVGVSGGIDSAVVSTLCSLTGLPTYCAIIDIHSNKEHLSRARDHCYWLEQSYPNCSSRSENMSNTLETIMVPDNGNHEHLAANTKSRLRMIALYNYAGASQSIVVGTGNKVEDFGIGYCTKGGDLCTDLSPIGDLYKTEVRGLGRYLGVSKEICSAAPSDGLFSDSRTDESVIGATYEELEWAMEKVIHIEPDGTPVFNTTGRPTDREVQVMQIYTKLHRQNQHKMLPIPIYKLSL